jgi:hypothetical protein
VDASDLEPAAIAKWDNDAHLRQVMQQALDDLAAQRRFPVIG